MGIYCSHKTTWDECGECSAETREELERVKTLLHALRHACAAIWTECEKDSPDMYDVQQIADEALELTKEHATKHKVISDTTGLESWHEYLARPENK